MSWETRTSSRTARVAAGLGMIALSLVAGCPSPPPSGLDGTQLVFRDAFDGATLESGWTFAGPDALKWSLSERSGYLRIYPEPLAANPDDTQDSLMLRPILGDFILITRMEYQTLEERQLSGLVVRGADGRLVSLGLTTASAALGTFRGVFMVADRGPDVTEGRANASFDGETVYLRLDRTGNSYTGYYSVDGVTFTVVGTLSNNLSDAVDVGVGTAKGRQCDSSVCNQSVPADFDFVEIRVPSQP